MDNKRAIALGFFDGVHIGHCALMEACRKAAEKLNCLSTALTFGTHPDTILVDRAFKTLSTNEQRAEMLVRIGGVDEVLTLPFDENVMRQSWKDFVTQTLIGRYKACHLVAGEDFRFGYKGEGTAEKLRAFCNELGIGCDIIPDVTLGGEVISTTLIKKYLSEGDLDKANRMLGHPYEISGVIEHGRGIGSRLLVPTVNIIPPETVFTPPFGVYVTRAEIGGSHPAVTNIGVRPTFHQHDRWTVETNLLDFSGNAYGESVRIQLLKFLRPERTFASVEDLREAIAEDIRAAKEYFEQNQ